MTLDSYLEKVTAFITRSRSTGIELLLFRHPHAGIQIPAGTVEPGEDPDQAVLREASEETGLSQLQIVRRLGTMHQECPSGTWLVREVTKVYARPDPSSFDWATFRSGIQVRHLRQENTFIQVAYEEWDRLPDPQYVTYQVTGWVPESSLCRQIRRHFYHLQTQAAPLGEHWLHKDEYHEFEPFWSSFESLPEIISPQDKWLEYVRDQLGNQFN